MKRALWGVLGLLVIAVLTTIYVMSPGDRMREWILEGVAIAYGVYVLVAVVTGRPVMLGPQTIKNDDPRGLRYLSAAVGLGFVLVGVYLLLD